MTLTQVSHGYFIPKLANPAQRLFAAWVRWHHKRILRDLPAFYPEELATTLRIADLMAKQPRHKFPFRTTEWLVANRYLPRVPRSKLGGRA